GNLPMVQCEHGVLATSQLHDLCARLHAWALLGEHELATGEVHSRLGEQDHHLQREHVLAVEILMQAVVVASAIAKEQWRRPPLAGLVAALDEVCMRGGE